MDENRDSLADQAAAWVPPWERQPGEPVGDEPAVLSEPEPVVSPEPELSQPEPVVPVEPVPVEPVPVEPVPVEPAPVEPAPEEAAGTVPGQRPEDIGDNVPVPSGPASTPAVLALIDDAELRAALEAILLVVDEPVTDTVLAQVLEQPLDRIAWALAELSASYTAQGRGFDLRRAAGGWRLYTRGEYAPYVERFILDGQQVRLTQAALETLAVVAYKQPVTRSRISAIRGVNCDGVIRTLVNRGLVEECGSEPESGAYLYRTTTLFLEKLGLDSVAELPPLAPFLPDDVEEIADAQR